MVLRAVGLWFVLLVVAIANGAVRVGWLIPRLGDYTGHIISTLSLSVLILLVSWLASGWLGQHTLRQAVGVGILWAGMTMAFEFVGGHYLFQQPWDRLLADYNLSAGRIWVLVLVVTFLAPVLTRRVR